MTRREELEYKRFAREAGKANGKNFVMSKMKLLETFEGLDEIDYVMFEYDGAEQFQAWFECGKYELDRYEAESSVEEPEEAEQGQEEETASENEAELPIVDEEPVGLQSESIIDAVLSEMEEAPNECETSGCAGDLDSRLDSLSSEELERVKLEREAGAEAEKREAEEETALCVQGSIKGSMTVAEAADKIYEEIQSITESFFRVGYYLWYIKRTGGMSGMEFNQYVQSEFGLKKSSTANYIAIFERFSKKDDQGEALPEIKEEFKGYGYGQLSVMIALPESKLPEVSPDMTVNEIRRVKRGAESEEDERGEEEPEEHSALDRIVIFDRLLTEENVEDLFRTLRQYVGAGLVKVEVR